MDLTQIQTLLGLAASAVGLTGQAAATVDSIKKVFGGPEKADNIEAQQLLNSLASQLTSANMMNVQLSTVVKEIVAQIEMDNRFATRIARYKLVTTGRGEMIYVLRTECSNDEPAHHICPVCIEKEQKFYFVTGADTSDGKSCQGCGHYFQFKQTSLRKGQSTYS